MEITASTVYWVLQLDSMHKALLVMLMVSGMIGTPATVFLWATVIIDKKTRPSVAILVSIFVASVFLIAGCTKIFLPSTNTAIAMYTIPKLLNSQAMYTLEGDAKELYKLGVERLKRDLKEETRK